MVQEKTMPVSEHWTIKDGQHKCSACEGTQKQLISKPVLGFMRESFPAGWNDDITGEPIYLKDKAHAKDVLAQNGVTSGYIENMDR